MKQFFTLKWFSNISIAKKLFFMMGIMVLIIVIELGSLLFAISTLSSVRAYVGGEGLWSKAQKNAIYHLQKYGTVHDESDYREFQEFMKIPLGDKKSRLELEKKNPNLNIARLGFLDGRNHPDDIDGMIKLYRRFHFVTYMDKAINIWTEADPIIVDLIPIGEKLHSEINSKYFSQQNINQLLQQIDHINSKLSKLEDDFSYTLGEGSRWLEGFILKILFVVALTVVLGGLLLTISVRRGIQKGLNEINRALTIVSKGDFSTRAIVYSNDEIGALANSFNKMTDQLQKKIEEKKIMDKTINQQNAIYEALVNAQSEMGDGVSILEDARFVYVNNALCNIYGYTKEELLALPSFLDLVAPGEREGIAKRMQERMKGNAQSDTGEITIIHKDGHPVNIAYSVKMMQVGGCSQLFSIIRDVSGQKLTEQKIKNSEFLLAESQQISHIGSWEWDTLTNRIYWSDELYRIFGFEPQDFEPNYESYLKCIHPDDRVMVDNIVQKALKDDKRFKFFHKIIRSNGDVRIIHSQGNVVVDENNKSIIMRGVAEDVTEQKKIEEELKISEKKFIKLLESVPDSIVIINTNGEIILVNAQTEKLFGYKRTELLGNKIELFILSHFHDKNYFNTLLSGEMGVGFESSGKRKNETVFPIEISLNSIQMEESTWISASIRDITDRKKTEKEMAKRDNEFARLQVLEQFKKLTVGREMKMIELKKENAELIQKLKKAINSNSDNVTTNQVK